jgi:hypothetical protein
MPRSRIKSAQPALGAGSEDVGLEIFSKYLLEAAGASESCEEVLK